MPIIDKILRAGEGKTLRKLEGITRQVNALEPAFEAMSDDELRALTPQYRARLADGETLDHLLPEAFATVREAAKRTLGQRHYDVQIMGGGALHLGNIAEMKTGEGKTLVSTLPAYLNALTGDGVHIVTVNDYLAHRDAENMGRVHRFLGLKVGVILSRMTPAERRVAYGADITYGTNNEFGFDYLRDNMAWTKEEMVQRGHHFAIVDEVDSILIDEARTPLIISGPADEADEWYRQMAKLASRLRIDVDYEVDEKKRTVGILEHGITRTEDWLGIDNLYEPQNTRLVGYLNNAIKAKELFRRDRDYVVLNGEVMIVDEHTGRMLHGRRYNEGLHQAIEAKEGVEVKAENQTLATVTLQNFFRLYTKLAGMTGTAMTEANEFSKIYKLGVVPIPTNRPMIRGDLRDLVYRTEDAKWSAVVADIAERHAAGQPILVGTVSVEKSEKLSGLLRKEGVPHQVLNAKYHDKEAAIIAQAGRKGAVTVATNMAGRGTDIILGGNAEFLADLSLQQQGLTPSETPDEYEEAWPAALHAAQEAFAAEHVEVTDLGGLYVLATERHESRRIDNQLRGRSGRQGDPGASRFYLSLQDDLMRLFKAEMVDAFLRRANVPDEQPIESKMVTKAIQSAQTQVEAQHFEIRKDVLKYDDVMNRQRLVIYGERRRVLEGEDIHEQVQHFLADTVDGYVTGATAEGYPEQWDLEGLWKALRGLYPIAVTIEEVEAHSGGRSGVSRDYLREEILADARAAYEAREEELGAETMRELERRVILSVLDRKWREHLYEMDYLRDGIGLRAMAQRDPLVEYQREGFDLFNAMMDSIKEETVGLLFNLEVTVQEAEEAEEAPIELGIGDARGVLPDLLAEEAPAEADESEEPVVAPAVALVGDDGDGAEPAGEAVPTPAGGAAVAAGGKVVKGLEGLGPRRPDHLRYTAPSETGEVVVQAEADGGEFAGVGRNALCPCGSGKKFKRCHGDPRLRN
ncbi:MAG: preprotein translocase subunit SecA [Candidatus Nanopelagicales bacterium]|nr:preprotein translocase subunit SecA [Candidatus Nanopelagicales bacterium]